MFLLILFALNVQHALADVRWLSRTEYMMDADDWESFDFYTENRGLRQTLWDFIIYGGLYHIYRGDPGNSDCDKTVQTYHQMGLMNYGILKSVGNLKNGSNTIVGFWKKLTKSRNLP